VPLSIGWLTRKVVRADKTSSRSFHFVILALASILLATTPSFFALLLSLVLLYRQRTASASGQLVRLYLLPTVLSAIEVFGSRKFHISNILRNG
jgi:ABC-type uncharacterized transport system YnjBCD permease subunit